MGRELCATTFARENEHRSTHTMRQNRGKLTSNLPLGAVLGPQADSELFLGHADALVNLGNTIAKVLSALSDLGVGQPIVLVLVLLSGLVPVAGAEAVLVGVLADGIFEEVVKGLQLRVERGQQRLIAVAKVPVDGTAARALRVGDGDTAGGAGSRRSAVLLDVGLDGSFGRHDGGELELVSR